jgi:hypothetical protein
MGERGRERRKEKEKNQKATLTDFERRDGQIHNYGCRLLYSLVINRTTRK